jgi:hypothetical protein
MSFERGLDLSPLSPAAVNAEWGEERASDGWLRTEYSLEEVSLYLAEGRV